MHMLLKKLKQEVYQLIDADFLTIEDYYRWMGLGYQIPGPVIAKIRHIMDVPDDLIEDNYANYAIQRRAEEFIEALIAPLKNRFDEILIEEQVDTSDCIQDIIDELVGLEKGRLQAQQARRKENENALRKIRNDLAPILEKIKQLEAEKQNIKIKEIKQEVDNRLKKLFKERDELQAQKKRWEEQSISETNTSEGTHLSLAAFAQTLAPYYEARLFSLKQIINEESDCYKSLKEILKGKLPEEYLDQREKTLLEHPQTLVLPDDWHAILAEQIRNDDNLKLGALFFWEKKNESSYTRSYYDHPQENQRIFSLLFEENASPAYTFSKEKITQVRNRINEFRLSLMQVLVTKPLHVLIDQGELIFKIAEGTAIKLRFRRLPEGKGRQKKIFLHVVGKAKEDKDRKPIKGMCEIRSVQTAYFAFSGSGYNLPHGITVLGSGYKIEVDFLASPLLIHNHASAMLSSPDIDDND